MRRNDWLIFSLLLVIIFVIEIFVVQRFLTSQVPGANDFYSRWYGGRAFLLEGRNPYGLDVTEEIQPTIGIDPKEVGRGGFNYPLHVIFFFWPLVYLPYDWAQATWWTVVLWLAIASAVILLQWLDVKNKPRQLLTFILLALTFYPITRSIFLGQFTIHVLFFLALSLLALKRRQDFLAGIVLSAASIKPQMLILVVPWLVIWAITQKRWKYVQGILVGGAVLLATSLALLPRWPLEFLADTRRYRQFSGGFNPLKLVFDLLWPNGPSVLWMLPAALLVLTMLFFWWRNGKDDSDAAFKRSMYWTIAIQILVTFQTGTTNQVILLIPILGWLASVRGTRWVTFASWTTTGLVWTLSWVLFLTSIDANYENPIMFPILPLLTLFLLSIQSIRRPTSNTNAIAP